MIDQTEEDDETHRSSRNDGVSKRKRKKSTGLKGDKAKRALIGAGGRILFYPTVLFNLVRFKLQSQFRWWDQIDEVIVLLLYIRLIVGIFIFVFASRCVLTGSFSVVLKRDS